MADYSEEIQVANDLIGEFGGDIEVQFQGVKDVLGNEVTPEAPITVTCAVFSASAQGRGVALINNTQTEAGDKYLLFRPKGMTKDLEDEEGWMVTFFGTKWRKIACERLSPDSSSLIIWEAIVRQ